MLNKKNNIYNKVYLIQTNNNQLKLLKIGLKANEDIKSITTYTVKDNDITFININLSQTMIYTEFEVFAKSIIEILGKDTKIFYKDNTKTICFQYTPISLINEKKKVTMNFIQDDCDDKD
jgi:hypothetical protein